MIIRSFLAPIALFLILSFNATLKAQNIKEIESRSDGDFTLMAVDFSVLPELKFLELGNPTRLVIDMPTTRWAVPAHKLNVKAGAVLSVRFAQFNHRTSRLVVDLNEGVSLVSRHISHDGKLLLGFAQKGLALDQISTLLRSAAYQPMEISNEYTPNKYSTKKYGFTDNKIKPKLKPKISVSKSTTPVPHIKPNNLRHGWVKPVIILDPGHGGRDPGAIAANGILEKDLTLAFAKILRQKLLSTGLFEVRLTRTLDSYISLDERVERAVELEGDLMISIHADSNPVASLRGASVYTLSDEASDSAAAMAAKRENAQSHSTILHSGHSHATSEILMDLAFRSQANSSSKAAKHLVDEMSKVWPTLKKPHRHAGFRVLKNAKMPALLLEMGYLSNKSDTWMLQQNKKQHQLARSLVKGIERIFDRS